jgi:integrase
VPKRDEPLYRRGGIWWCRVRNRSGRIVRKSTRCRDREAAIVEWRALERAAVDQDYGASTEATLSECVADYVADLERRGVSPVTVKIAKEKCGHFARLWRRGAMPMAKVDAPLVEEYIDQRLREGVARYTIKRELQHLGTIVSLAFYHGKFHLPVGRVIPPTFKAGFKRKKRAPTPDEFSRFMVELGPNRAAQLLFILATGARRGEAFRAQRKDVDWAAGEVLLRGSKTEASWARVPITPIMETYLRWAIEHAPGKARLFNPWGNIWRDMNAACVRAGIENLSCNDLRRAFGTWHREALMLRGGSERSASELTSKLLRHKTDKLVQTTYADLDARAIGGVVTKLLGPVPELYQSTVTTSETEHNWHTSETRKAKKTLENTGAGQGTRIPDLRLGKPGVLSASDSYESRLSTGTKLGRQRARETRGVLKLYRSSLLSLLAARMAALEAIHGPCPNPYAEAGA